MKVLLVTDQHVDVRNDRCYCNYALLGTLRNITVLGDLYIVAAQQSELKRAAQPVNQEISFITSNRVWHTKPVTVSIRDYYNNKKYNRKLLEEIMPNMDLIIGYNPGHNMHYAFKIARQHNIPYMSFLVACPWDSMHNHQRLLVRIMAPIYYLRTKKIVKESDYVHYVTSSFLQKRYPTKGLSLGCSDVHLWEYSQNILNKRLKLLEQRTPSSSVSIVTTAHIDMRFKGQEYVIKAVAELNKTHKNKYHYYLIGDGSGEYLKELSARLKVEDNIHFLGRKTIEEIRDILAAADIYIQPSLQEGLPRAVVEAMSMALPCIGFNTGGIPELIQSQFVVPKKDVSGLVNCIRALDDIELCKNVAERNFNGAKKFEHSYLTTIIQDFFINIKEGIEKK